MANLGTPDPSEMPLWDSHPLLANMSTEDDQTNRRWKPMQHSLSEDPGAGTKLTSRWNLTATCATKLTEDTWPEKGHQVDSWDWDEHWKLVMSDPSLSNEATEATSLSWQETISCSNIEWFRVCNSEAFLVRHWSSLTCKRAKSRQLDEWEGNLSFPTSIDSPSTASSRCFAAGRCRLQLTAARWRLYGCSDVIESKREVAIWLKESQTGIQLTAGKDIMKTRSIDCSTCARHFVFFLAQEAINTDKPIKHWVQG